MLAKACAGAVLELCVYLDTSSCTDDTVTASIRACLMCQFSRIEGYFEHLG